MKNLLFKLKTKFNAFVGKCKQILSDKVNLIALSFLGIIAIADLFGANSHVGTTFSLAFAFYVLLKQTK